MCVLAWMHLCFCVLCLQTTMFVPQICVHMHVHFCVCVSTCVYAHLSFLHAFARMSISMLCPHLSAHLHLHGSVTVYLCSACVQNRYESVLRFRKWTLDLLGTRWRQANLHCLPEPLYNDWDGRSCLLTLQCCFETRKMTSQKDNLSCVAWPIPSSRVTLSGSISCLFLGRRAWTLTLLSTNHLL